MGYNIIQPPFTMKFRDMSKSELRDYYDWFIHSITERIEELKGAINDTAGAENLRLDFSPDSLVPLAKWFATQIQTCPKLGDEKQPNGTFGYLINDQSSQLTNKALSLAVDVGMYFSQILLRKHPHIKWTQFLNDTAFADYGQPVLTGFGPVPLNPVRIAVTFTQGLATGKQTPSRLRQLFDYWAGRAAVLG